jgi:hypothetical protein
MCDAQENPVFTRLCRQLIKPLKKRFSFFAGACSLGQDRSPSASRKTPATPSLPGNDSFSSFRATLADVGKGMISYRIGCSECEHRRASNRQHARKGLFSWSVQPCQGLIFGIFGPELPAIEPAVINGTAGALLYLDGEVDQTLSMASEGDLITAIYIVRNPDKLRSLPPRAANHRRPPLRMG